MSNGIDNIYDTSDVRRQLYEIGQERQRLIEDKRRRRAGTIEAGKNLLSLWKAEQGAKTQELLSIEDNSQKVFEMNPEYMEKSGIERFFTKAENKIRPIQTTRTEIQEDVIAPSKEPGIGSPEFGPREVTITEPRAKEFLEANPGLLEPKGIGKTASKTFGNISDTSEEFFGSDLGKWLSAGGALSGGYNLMKNWNKRGYKDIDKAFDIGKTALSAATFLKPGLGVWGLGLTALDWLRKK
tara:strand:+ start:5468 stop:6187 length:720 start_codon:yes stop_codon:yes gene_type:complete